MFSVPLSDDAADATRHVCMAGVTLVNMFASPGWAVAHDPRLANVTRGAPYDAGESPGVLMLKSPYALYVEPALLQTTCPPETLVACAWPATRQITDIPAASHFPARDFCMFLIFPAGISASTGLILVSRVCMKISSKYKEQQNSVLMQLPYLVPIRVYLEAKFIAASNN
jgi:hypothetical protein